MSRKCEICGRGPSRGATRSHSNIQSKKWVHLNLQTKTIEGKKTKICTKCLKVRAKKAKI